MSAAHAAGGRRCRIAIAEDDADLRDVLRDHLESEGFAVSDFHDGRELLDALVHAPAGHFDLVICDQYMPVLRGTECLAFAGSRTRFVIITGRDDPRIRSAARQFGALAFLRKPIDLDELVTLILELTDPEPTTGVRSRIPESEPPR